MQKVMRLTSKIKHLINYIYYFKSSLTKNIYPYKLVGEKIEATQNNTVILYKARGQAEIKEIPLQDLLHNKMLVEQFHSSDALQLGLLAFKDVIAALMPEERKAKYNHIKNIMLNSTHDTYPSKEIEYIAANYNISDNEINSKDCISALFGNFYPYKLVGVKRSSYLKTTVIFTIFGKRDGYEKILQEIISDKKLLEKFHPTEAVKFGFISTGDQFFELSEIETPKQINAT